MILKQVARLDRSRFARRVALWKPWIHPLLVARIALSLLMVPQGLASATAPPGDRYLDPDAARATEQLLSGVFRAQQASGDYALAGPSRALATHPLYATMALDAWRATRNTAALSQATYSVARYYGFLFSSSDRDGDRLVETPAPWRGRGAVIEDPAFNALLAADARSLAVANLELRRTMQALFWYDGARSVERAVVAGTFDPGAAYCFARDPVNARPLRSFSPAAAIPSEFRFVVGDNHAERMRAHVVRWAGESTASPVADGGADEAALDRLAAIDVLRFGSHGPVLESLRAAARADSSRSPLSRYARGRAEVTAALVEDDVALGIFHQIVRAAPGFTDGEKFRFDRAVPEVRAMVFSAQPPASSPEAAGASISALYETVARLREMLRSSSFFSPEDRRAYPGVDANIATQRLLDDVASILRRAENRLFEWTYAGAGARVAVRLAADDVVVSESINARWEVAADRAPLSWVALSAGVFGEAIAPVNAGPGAAPGSPLRFSTRVTGRGVTGSLRLLTFTAVFESAPGRQHRYHVDRSLFVHPPVGVAARFPQGRTIQGGVVPVELDIRRHAGAPVTAKYFWFSPSGLKLREGNSGTVSFGPADSTLARLHVEVPEPCRPGLFPFTLKFYAGDKDAGSIATSLFKPYQWTYVGTFPADGGLDRPYPPEQGVNLLQNYTGPGGSLRWRPVPESACGPRGEISLRDLAADRGTSYLYTIVSCAYETDIVARLSASGPAALFVNGRRVAAVTSARGDSASAVVRLDPDKNHIVLKIIGDRDTQVSFALGNDENLAADEFNNDLAELAGGYRELTARELATGSAPSESRRLVTLRFTDPEAASVAVVGSFNGWSPETHRMQKRGDAWELTLSLAPGRYAYRFLVDAKKQVLDPASAATEADGYGGKNSVLVVRQ
jgi:hypothetical protein